MTFSCPFQHFYDPFVNDKKGHNFINNKIILSRSNYNLFSKALSFAHVIGMGIVTFSVIMNDKKVTISKFYDLFRNYE